MARLIVALVAVALTSGTFGSEIERTYREHRARILGDGFLVTDGYVFSVGRVRSRTETPYDEHVYSKARLLAKGHLSRLAYADVDWPPSVSDQARNAIIRMHSKVHPQRYGASEMTALDEFSDSTGLHVAVIGADRDRVAVEALSFNQIKVDLFGQSEMPTEGCELAMLKIEIAEPFEFDGAIAALGRCLSHQIHPDYEAIFRLDADALGGRDGLDLRTFGDDQIRTLSESDLFRLYAIQAFDPRVAFWTAHKLEADGYSRTAQFFQSTGALSREGDVYASMNRQSLMGEDDFSRYLSRRVTELSR